MLIDECARFGTFHKQTCLGTRINRFANSPVLTRFSGNWFYETAWERQLPFGAKSQTRHQHKLKHKLQVIAKYRNESHRRPKRNLLLRL